MADINYPQLNTEQFMRLAEQGQVPKDVLANRLQAESRKIYLDTCAEIERRFARECESSGDPCLESGCSIDHEHGETCLQPLLRAETEYLKACGAEWIRLVKAAHHEAV